MRQFVAYLVSLGEAKSFADAQKGLRVGHNVLLGVLNCTRGPLPHIFLVLKAPCW